MINRDKSFGNDPDQAVRIMKRRQFNAWKKTDDYKEWYNKQWDFQRGRCAWCERKLRSPKRVHVDHIMPIFHNGTNNKSNLCLSHAKCNIKKFVRIESYPFWMRRTRENDELRTHLTEIRKQQQEVYDSVMEQILDERALGHELLVLVKASQRQAQLNHHQISY